MSVKSESDEIVKHSLIPALQYKFLPNAPKVMLGEGGIICIPNNVADTKQYRKCIIEEVTDGFVIYFYFARYNSGIANGEIQKTSVRYIFNVDNGKVTSKFEHIQHPEFFEHFEHPRDFVPNPHTLELHADYPKRFQAKYTGEKVFVNSINRLYVKLEGYWIEFCENVETFNKNTKRLPSDVVAEVNRYLLAVQLSNK